MGGIHSDFGLIHWPIFVFLGGIVGILLGFDGINWKPIN